MKGAGGEEKNKKNEKEEKEKESLKEIDIPEDWFLLATGHQVTREVVRGNLEAKEASVTHLALREGRLDTVVSSYSFGVTTTELITTDRVCLKVFLVL